MKKNGKKKKGVYTFLLRCCLFFSSLLPLSLFLSSFSFRVMYVGFSFFFFPSCFYDEGPAAISIARTSRASRYTRAIAHRPSYHFLPRRLVLRIGRTISLPSPL